MHRRVGIYKLHVTLQWMLIMEETISFSRKLSNIQNECDPGGKYSTKWHEWMRMR